MVPVETSLAASLNREIVSKREFTAPRDRLYGAFADSAQLVHWWGPNGFTNTIQEFDLRPGGRWRLVMRAPNGAEFQNESEFTVVEPAIRVVYQHLEPIHRFQMTMLFADDGNQSELTWRMLFESVSECDRVKRFITDANEQNFDRLAAHLTHSA